MKAALLLTVAGGLGGMLLAQAPATSPNDPSVETYESLATAIIALSKTEDGLMLGILTHYHADAQQALTRAANLAGAEKKTALEQAADHVVNLANEGDKSVQVIKQRLLKAGHTHHTDAETKEDYLWIDSKEKKGFLTLAQRISQMTPETPAADIQAMQTELGGLFQKATQGD